MAISYELDDQILIIKTEGDFHGLYNPQSLLFLYDC